MIAAPAFHFDEANHTYTLDGVVIPSVTQLLEKGGLVDGAAYFTEESRKRGTEVHRLCQNYDLGALDVNNFQSPYRGYVMAYVAAMKALKPEWHHIEEADVHFDFRFGGRPDRGGLVFGRMSAGELKSAAKAAHHAIQTALQAILFAQHWHIPAEMIQRLCFYLKSTGRFVIEEHTDPRDFLTARKLIREHCR